MPKDIFIINNGDVIVTPCAVPDENTVSLKFGNEYHKLRHIQVELVSKVTNSVGIQFNPSAWYQVGTGNLTLLFNKAQVDFALDSIKDLQRKIFTNNAFHSCRSLSAQIESLLEPASSPLSRVFMGILSTKPQISIATRADREKIIDDLFKEQFKITCIMNPENELQVVATIKINVCSEKIIKYMTSIWEKATSDSLFGPVAALAKGKKGMAHWLLYEAQISENLFSVNAPYILPIMQVTRGNPEKVGLMMEYCNCGNLAEFASSHFNPNTRAVLPEYRFLHISLLRQVTDALCCMHTQNLIHRDVKAENALVTCFGGAWQVRLADFPSTVVNMHLTKFHAGSYPPPEIQRAFEQSKEEALTKLSQSEEDEYARRVEKWRRMGLKAGKIKEKENAFLESRISESLLTTQVDAWALGVLICQTMHNLPELIKRMDWESPSLEILKARKNLLDLYLDPQNDCVDKVAISLLEHPFQRISTHSAHDLLRDAT